MKSKLEIDGQVFKATLMRAFAPNTVEKIMSALPIESEIMV